MKNHFSIDQLARLVLEGEPRAVAKAISLAENNSSECSELLKKIFPYTGDAVVIGITGAPGSGKSTLVDGLLETIQQEEGNIGVIAVDPSSPFTGGAVLGDRIRMMRHSENPAIFIRSMATRGQLGGLAKATGEAVFILAAAGKKYIILETVGVGQDEVEVVRTADLVTVVLVPGLGDEIQNFKAGIMEIADIFVLNKADAPDAERTQRQLQAMLEMGNSDHPTPPLLKTVAVRSQGISNLFEQIKSAIEAQSEAEKAMRKKRFVAGMLRDIVRDKLYKELGTESPDKDFMDWVERIHRREIDPYSAAEAVLKSIKGRGV